MRTANVVSSSPGWSLRKRLHAGRPTIYRVTDCLHAGRTVRVPHHDIAATVSAWLDELGAHSPQVDDLAQAVFANEWPAADAIGAYLSVDVTVEA